MTSTLIQIRRGTATQWSDANPVLHAGEIGFETDTGKFKIGTGTASWNDEGFGYAAILPTALGAANGVATLDANGHVPTSQLPDLVKVTVHAVADHGSLLGLTTNDVQPGDIAIQTNTGDTYVLAAADPSVEENWDKITVADPFPSHNTDDLSEGSTNKYFTSQRAIDAVGGAADSSDTPLTVVKRDADGNFAAGTITANLTGQVSDLSNHNTDDVSEGTTNKYFTDQRAIDAVGGSASSENTPLTVVKRDGSGNFSAGTITADLTGNVTGQVSDLSNHTTSDLTEGTNLYYTSERANTDVADQISMSISSAALTSTDGLSEGTTNLYFTNERAQDAVGNILGTGFTYNDSSNVIGVNHAEMTTIVVESASGNSYGLVGTSAYLVVKDTNGYNKEIELDIASVESKLDTDGYLTESSTSTLTNKTLSSPTLTGTASADAIETTGNVTVGGDLIVNGTTTTINSTTISVDDKNIELGSVASPTDSTANGGGLTLKGTTDKTFNWVSGTSSWTSSENVDLASGETYKIAGTDVLTSTQVLGKSLPTGTVVGTSDSQTLSGKTISGSDNTLSNIGNSSLTNSKVTLGTTDVSLGTTASNIDGLTINSTTIPTSKTLVTTADSGTVTSTMIADGTIVDADINASAGISDTKLGTISTSGKVSNSATSATPSNTANAIVARNSSGDFTAGTITANLTGNVTGDVTGTVSSLSNHTTDDLSEGSTNKYYTAERAQDDVFNAVSNGTGISTTYTDSSNLFTITNTGVTSLAGTTNQITASGSTGSITLSLPNNVVLPGDLEVNGNTIIDGDLQVKGTTTTVNTQTVSVQDNLIYLNASLSMAITGATHDTTTVEYEVADNSQIATGMAVRVTDVTPSNYNIASSDNVTVLSKRSQGNNHYFTVTKTVSVTYTSGGTAEFKINADPDLGLAGGYYEAGYAHAGLFRDASDSGIWKFFQGYTPEPDAATTIDTTDASFAFASLQAADFRGSGAYLTSIPNSALVNSTISGVSLGSDLNALTIGTGLSGTSYNGSAGVTIAIDSTVATLSGTQTLTGKTISGASNTLSNIGNSSLTNSSITVNGTSFALGDSKTIKASTTNSLTIGTGLSGTSFDGGSAITIAIDSTVATLTGSQTLTNKTLTSPVISSISNTGTLTLPTSTDTLVGRATTDTLTNKTLTSPVIGTIVNTGTLTLPTSTDTLVGRATTDTLTNKTLTTPVIASISNSGTLTLPTSTDTLVGKATTDTLTNKTFDTAGTGNVLKINGTQVSAVTGTGSVVLSATPTFTGTVNAAAVTTTGDVIVGGNLTVNGTTETINSTTLTVTDKNIEIGNVASPTDTTANGGGITLHGTTDKTLNWVSTTPAWTSSENFDLASGKTYKIAGTTVLSASQVLGKTIGGTSSGDIADISTAQTFTNKTISGSANTLTNIGNSSLTNSSVTVGTTAISLGNSATTIAGLSSVTSTSFTGALTGNASTATKLAATKNINGVAFDGSADITVKATATNALTIGTGLSGTSYDGSSAVTVAIDSTVATLTGTQTLTNKTLTSPTLTTPALGVATATSVNKVAITAPATSATLTLADGSTLATSGAFSTTLTATAATSVTLPTSGTLISSASYTAKGNVLVGTGSGTFTNLGVGTDTFVLTADSTQTSGVKWVAPAASGPSYTEVIMQCY